MSPGARGSAVDPTKRETTCFPAALARPFVGLTLVVAFLLLCLLNKAGGGEGYSRPWRILPGLAFLAAFYWAHYSTGSWLLSLLLGKESATRVEPALAIAVGMAASIFYFLVLGLCDSLNTFMVFLPFAAVLFASAWNLEKVLAAVRRMGSADWRARLPVLLAVLGSGLVFAFLFSENIFRGEFQRDPVDVFILYLHNLVYHLKTGSLHRLYFSGGGHINPFLYSSLTYLPVIGLTSAQTLPLFAVCQMVLGAGLCYSLARRTLGNRWALLAPPVMLLGIRAFYLRDFGMNLYKYPYSFAMLFALVPVAFFLDWHRVRRTRALLLAGGGTGLLLGDLSLAFPPLVIGVLLCLLLTLRQEGWIGTLKGMVFFCLGVAVVGVVPYLVNIHYCGAPAGTTVMPWQANLFDPHPELYSELPRRALFGAPVKYGPRLLNMRWSILGPLGEGVLATHFLIIAFVLWVRSKSEERARHLPVFVLLAATCLWFVYIPFLNDRIRYRAFLLPMLGLAFPFYLHYLCVAVRGLLRRFAFGRTVRVRKLAAVTVGAGGLMLLGYTGVLPDPLAGAKDVVRRFLWFRDGYGLHHAKVQEFTSSNVVEYVRNNLREDEKILFEGRTHPVYSLGRITVHCTTLPYYSLFVRDKKKLFKRLGAMKIRYFLVVEGQSMTAPFRPLFLSREFAVRHLRLVACSRFSCYLDNDEDYLVKSPGERSAGVGEGPMAYLFEFSERPLPAGSSVRRRTGDVIGAVKLKMIHEGELRDEIRSFRLPKPVLARTRRVDELLTAEPHFLDVMIEELLPGATRWDRRNVLPPGRER